MCRDRTKQYRGETNVHSFAAGKWNSDYLSLPYKNLKEICKRADILVAAIGKPKFIDDSYVKEGAVVIDVGIHRNENNKLCGDVDFDKVEPVASAITPVQEESVL